MKSWDDRSLLPTGMRAFSRRELLGWITRGTGALAAGLTIAPSMASLLARQAFGAVGSQGTSGALRSQHRRLIVLWLEGGPSQLDTFDPKPGHANGGGVQALPTDVPGWSFASSLPQLARRARHLAVIRSMTSKEGNHSRARLLVQCGYVPTPTVTFPSFGSIVAHELGDLDHELPAFVQVGGAPIGGGYLGVNASPFVVNDPTGRIENLTYAPEVNGDRLDHREAMVEVLDESFARRGAAPVVDANQAQRKRARRLMESKLLSAFDLGQEKEAVRDAYGRNDFGQGVLLARRLIENGVQAVQVVLNGWDTHQDNEDRTRALNEQLDPAFASLLDDLERRRLLQETLIVCMGEFGRTPQISADGGRNHWPNNWCVALAGGSIRGGQAHGSTNEEGTAITEKPVQVADLFATLAAALRLDRDKEFHAGKRPIKLIDPEGRVVDGVLA